MSNLELTEQERADLVAYRIRRAKDTLKQNQTPNSALKKMSLYYNEQRNAVNGFTDSSFESHCGKFSRSL
ncbi:MAG: hypothetical protein LBG17_03745 [Bacteroidales bacterium]|nr:hypothetical protein [Bacteroidales bacterium]